METTFQVGAKMDLLAPNEYHDGVNKILKALGQNARFRRVINSAKSDGVQNTYIPFKPEPGYMWVVKWATFANGISTTFHGIVNDVNSPLNFAWVALNATIIGSAFGSWNSNQFPDKLIIIQPEDTLFVYPGGGAPAAGTTNNAQLGVIEVPVSHEAQLLL